MLDAEACGAEAHENVRCIDRAAHTLWRLSLDPSRDCAVALGAHPTDAGRLEIGTFGGWSLDVAITTGEILGRTFVK
ncbi:MAG: hypothetical protein IT548_18905 [Alphaproteobacteria bacterium]|nr:hypothetical protein [Alphaproteobacteria bacterium]